MVKKPLLSPYIGIPMNRPDLSDFFAGKEFSIFVDGVPEIKFKVNDLNTLSWLKNGVGWEEEYYECYESSSKGLYFLFHQVRNDFGLRVRVLAIDTANRLVTLLAGTLGLEDYTPRDTDASPFFGYIDWYDGAPAPAERHAYTMELIQKNILWSVGDYRLIHYYVNRRYYSRQMFGEENGLVTSERARHIRLRDNVYLFFWREMQSYGILGCDIMNLNEFNSVGLLYGVTDYRFICNGFTRETGKWVTDEELAEFERVFLESQDQTYALKTVFNLDLPKLANPLLSV
jgi:hypothetical protein